MHGKQVFDHCPQPKSLVLKDRLCSSGHGDTHLKWQHAAETGGLQGELRASLDNIMSSETLPQSEQTDEQQQIKTVVSYENLKILSSLGSFFLIFPFFFVEKYLWKEKKILTFLF